MIVGQTTHCVSVVLASIHVKMDSDYRNISYKTSEALWEAFRANLVTDLQFEGLTLGRKIKSMESTFSRNMKFTHNVD